MPPQDPAALKRLETLVQTTSTLIHSILPTIQAPSTSSSSPPPPPPPPPTTSSPEPPPNALLLARDSATLIRAHVTKLSLLIINEPFTPTAISTVLSALLSGGSILGLASASSSCDAHLYTALFQRELRWRCERTLVELANFLAKIPLDGKVLAGAKRDGFGGRKNDNMAQKGSLPATGLVWSACDQLISLSNMGVAGFFVQKTDEWRDTLDDIMQELKEWGDQEPDDDDNEDDDNDDDDETTSQTNDTQDLLDDLMNTHQTIPRSDPALIRPRLTTSLKNLRLVTLFFQATTKRRMKKLPPLPPSPTTDGKETTLPPRLDEIASLLANIPDRFGDLALAFYDLQPGEIDEAMVQCFLDAFAASELLSLNWDGAADEFTAWSEKFRQELKKS